MIVAARSRHGLSAVEFVACLSAMVGGVILGSMYLGVDVKKMGFALLQQAQLIDAAEAPETTENLESATEAVATVTSPATSETKSVPPASEATDGATEQVAAEIPAVPAEATPVPPAPPAANNPLAKLLNRDDLISLTDDQRRTLTISYWEALDACMKDECKNRLAGIRADGNFTLFDFLTCRKQGHQQAMEFISQLNLRGVDPHVAAYAEKALAWHKDGVTLFSRALDLLTDAPTAQFTGPFAQSWQSASTQHQMEERLLAEKHVAVQDYLDHTLLAVPAAPAEAATAATTPAPAAN